MKIAIVIHAFYSEQLYLILNKVQDVLWENKEHEIHIYITLPEERNDLLAVIDTFAIAATVQTFPNKGMDLLPFLSLISQLQAYDWVLKLHTKNCHDKLNKLWFETLVDELIGLPEIFFDTVSVLNSHHQWQMAGIAPFFLSAHRLMLNNRSNIDKLADLWQVDVHRDWGFFAGSLYWLKPQFLLASAQKILQHESWFDEDYAKDGLMAHAVERLITLAAQKHGEIGLFCQSVKLVYSHRNPLAINQAFSKQLLAEINQLEETVQILAIDGVFDVEKYTQQSQIDFTTKELARIHYALIGQFSKLSTLVLPIALQRKQEKLVSWEKLVLQPRKKGLVSIIIPVFNELSLTLKCLKSIKEYTDPQSVEIIVVNNGSDRLVKMALDVYALSQPNCQILTLEQNLNFSVGCNYGFSKSTGQYVVFLNNDTVVTRGWLDPLLQVVQDENVAIAQPLLLYPDDTVQCAGVEFGDDGFGISRLVNQSKYDVIVKRSCECPALTAACMILRSVDFIALQGFSAWYVNGQEDIDLCLRMKKLYPDKKLWYCADSVVYHHESQTQGRRKHTQQNRFIFLLKNFKNGNVMFKSSLKLANQLFTEAKYFEAMTIYEDLVSKDPLFYSFLRFNIDLTNKRINQSIDRIDQHWLQDKFGDLEEMVIECYLTIHNSGLFDNDFYQSQNLDVFKSGVDPLMHFIQFGAAENRNPNSVFDTKFYKSQMNENEIGFLNPLYHYICIGRDKGFLTASDRSVSDLVFNLSELQEGIYKSIQDRSLEYQNTYKLIHHSGLFDREFYLKTYEDVADAKVDPLMHYIDCGVQENRHPSEGFNTLFYQSQMSKEDRSRFNPIEHYILIGKKMGLFTNRDPQRIFSALPTGEIYLKQATPSPGRIAVMAHIFYTDLMPKILTYLKNIPFAFDLLVSTDSKRKQKEIHQIIQSQALSNLSNVDIRVVENRGRDIAPMVVEFGRDLLNYDFALHVHSKKSPYGSDLMNWLDYTLEHLLHSPIYIAHALYQLSASNVGALITHPYQYVIGHMHWGGMEEYGRRVLEKLNIDPFILREKSLQFPAGSMFWFKPKALEPLLVGKIPLSDFELERGQLNNTLAHVIERLMLYIVSSQGYGYNFIRPAVKNESFIPFLLNPEMNKKYEVRCDKSPLVSIVLPVYNQWQYTYNCIVSILTFTDFDKVPYEIILADDCSSDETINAQYYFKNLKVSRTPHNLGFSGNCQLAASSAQGEYILFLNNDTQVQPNWLSSLIDVFREKDDALVVGSKLIYEDNVLQEAGGIVWKDASGCNYGRNDQDPSKSEYCYVKYSDYISGAAIMVPKVFWQQVGGFDDLFKPAYYEDTDLCMQARQQGGEVYLQPASQVIHFEGRSHGTDTSSGVKAYQVTNKENFRNKWKAVLNEQHTTGDFILNARERSLGKKVIAVIDLLLPEYDRHAGARHTFDYVKLLVEKGFVIKFLACKVDDLRQLQFARELEQMGVEVFYPRELLQFNNWNEWLKQRKDYIDAVIFNRPYVAEPHINTCRKLNIGMLYFCHDIHSLREYRLAINAGKEDLAQSILDKEGNEISIFKAMDYSYTPSTYEKKYLLDKHDIQNVGVLPLFLSQECEDLKCVQYIPEQYQVTFVGSMRHTPNHDAVIWFIKDVLPYVKNKKVVVNIVGPNPTDKLFDLAKKQKNIIIHGAVSEERLSELYNQSKVVVIPLLSGAGVKGKVIESFKNGVPIVSTSIGLEGIDGVSDILTGYDDAINFAKKVDELLGLEEDDWLLESEKLQDFYKSRYSFESGWQALLPGLKAVHLVS